MNEEDIKILEIKVNNDFVLNKYDNETKAIEHLLQAYKEQEKVIDEMAEDILGTAKAIEDEGYCLDMYFENREDVKQYFINKVKENKE